MFLNFYIVQLRPEVNQLPDGNLPGDAAREHQGPVHHEVQRIRICTNLRRQAGPGTADHLRLPGSSLRDGGMVNPEEPTSEVL